MSRGTEMTGAVGDRKGPLVRVRDVWYTFDKEEARDPHPPRWREGEPPPPEEELKKWVLKSNNLDLNPGELVIMTGQSGSGKTTLLTLIGGLRRLQRHCGSIEVNGRELFGLEEKGLIKLRRDIGFIFQAHNLFGSLTAVQNVRLALEVDGGAAGKDRTDVRIDRRAVELLKKLGLEKWIGHKPQKLSGGQKQRVAIARALANEPRLILADEPTAALDAESADIVVKMLKEVVKPGGEPGERTVVVVTHDTKILKAADRIVNMKYGRIVSNINIPRAEKICEFLQGHQTLRKLIPGILTELDFALADGMSREEFPAGERIIRYGDEGDKFYVVHKGAVEVRKPQEDGSILHVDLGEGQYFGEAALMNDTRRNADVFAKGPVELLVIAKNQFQEILKSNTEFDQVIRENMQSRR